MSTKFTPERRARILDALRGGNYAVTAARAVGISESTFYEWINRDPEWAEEVEQAKAEAEQALLKIIKDAAADTWQASAWILERTRPQRWAKREAPREDRAAGDYEVDLSEPDDTGPDEPSPSPDQGE